MSLSRRFRGVSGTLASAPSETAKPPSGEPPEHLSRRPALLQYGHRRRDMPTGRHAHEQALHPRTAAAARPEGTQAPQRPPAALPPLGVHGRAARGVRGHRLLRDPRPEMRGRLQRRADPRGSRRPGAVLPALLPEDLLQSDSVALPGDVPLRDPHGAREGDERGVHAGAHARLREGDRRQRPDVPRAGRGRTATSTSSTRPSATPGVPCSMRSSASTSRSNPSSASPSSTR